jgi:hypothetical protein
VEISGLLQAWHRGGSESFRRSERSLDRLGFVGEVCGGDEPRVLSSSPHLLNIALRDGGPPVMYEAGRLQLGRWIKARDENKSDTNGYHYITFVFIFLSRFGFEYG